MPFYPLLRYFKCYASREMLMYIRAVNGYLNSYHKLYIPHFEQALRGSNDFRRVVPKAGFEPARS